MTGVNPRYPLFDSLRAIAALSVFADHLPYAIHTSPDNVLRPFLFQLNAGVSIFFLISGFLLYRPFARARLARESAPETGPYAWRRILRIGPAYWVALPLTVLLLGNWSETFSSPGHAVQYFGFLQVYNSDTLLGGISAAWTLCVEVAFYAMLPIWAFAMRRVGFGSRRSFVRTELIGLGLLYVAGMTWTSVAAINENLPPAVLVHVELIPPWLYVLPAFLDQFALGMALAVFSVTVADQAREPKPVRFVDRHSWVPWVLAAVAFFLLSRTTLAFHDFGATAISAHVMQGVFAFFLLVPAVFGDPDRGVVRRFLGNRALLWVGLVSYGLYLWHAAIIQKLADLGAVDSLPQVPFIALALALSLGAAAASFYGIERHALRLARRLSHRRRSQDADMRARDLRQHERPPARVG